MQLDLGLSAVFFLIAAIKQLLLSNASTSNSSFCFFQQQTWNAMQAFFRVFYSSTYTVVFIVLILLLAVTPGDTIYQSINDLQLQNVFIVTGAYVVAAVLVLSFYGSRLYTSRAALAAIPKTNVPIEASGVGQNIRQLVEGELKRSAIIAWYSKPRGIRAEPDHESITSEERSKIITSCKHDDINNGALSLIRCTERLIALCEPPWGSIKHPGWSSPSSLDFPNVQFSKVIDELANIIEAKAVSLASPDNDIEGGASDLMTGVYISNEEAIALLRRSIDMDLREYLARLMSFGIMNDEDIVVSFLAQYEKARYSGEELKETQFRDLMISFSTVLSAMADIKKPALAQILDASRDTGNNGYCSTNSTNSNKSIRSFDITAEAGYIGPRT